MSRRATTILLVIAGVLFLASRLAAQTGPSQCIYSGYDWDTSQYLWVCAGEGSGLAITKTGGYLNIRTDVPDLSGMLQRIDDLEQLSASQSGELLVQQQTIEQQGLAIADLQTRVQQLEQGGPGVPPTVAFLQRIAPPDEIPALRAQYEAAGWEYQSTVDTDTPPALAALWRRFSGDWSQISDQRARSLVRVELDTATAAVQQGYDVRCLLDPVWLPLLGWLRKTPIARNEALRSSASATLFQPSSEASAFNPNP